MNIRYPIYEGVYRILTVHNEYPIYNIQQYGILWHNSILLSDQLPPVCDRFGNVPLFF